jgi:hypothetical protein
MDTVANTISENACLRITFVVMTLGGIVPILDLSQEVWDMIFEVHSP